VALVVALVAALAAGPLLLDSLDLHYVWEAASWSVAVLGVNLAVGYGGMIALGHAAFVGVGAYTTVILSADHGWPLLATVPAAGALCFAVGYLVAVPALRFRGFYLAFLTLAVGTSFGPIVKRLRWLTNGSDGKSSPARVEPPAWFGRSREAERVWLYVVVVTMTLAVFVVAANLVRGRTGRALEAMRTDELSATTFGVSVGRMRMALFGISAAVSGIGGALLMLPSPFATEYRFDQTVSFQLYAAAFLGGIGVTGGSVLGGTLVAMLPYMVNWFGVVLEPALIYGVALVVVTLFFPDGVVGVLRRLVVRRGRAVGDRTAG
jgi:branched-chain amino acid transport system permease protein